MAIQSYDVDAIGTQVHQGSEEEIEEMMDEEQAYFSLTENIFENR
jgi:hypothetical protein